MTSRNPTSRRLEDPSVSTPPRNRVSGPQSGCRSLKGIDRVRKVHLQVSCDVNFLDFVMEKTFTFSKF